MTKCVKRWGFLAVVVGLSQLASGESSAASVTYVTNPALTAQTLNNTGLRMSAPMIDKSALINSNLFLIQRTIQNGIGVRLYDRAVKKALAELPSLIGPVIQENDLSFVFAHGEDTYLFCDFGYTLGVRNGDFRMDLSPSVTTLDFGFRPGNEIGGTFNIDVSGSIDPYASVNLCDLWEPEASPTVSASGLYGSVSLTASIISNQLTVTNAAFDGHLAYFHVDLGPISWFLDLITLHDEFDDWIRGIVLDKVNSMVSAELPGAMTSALRDKLNFSDTIQGFDYAIQPSQLTTSYNGMTMRVNSTLSAHDLAPTCPGPTCFEPAWPAVSGTPADYDATADAAASIGVSVMNQAFFAFWRGGKLQFEEDMDAQEVLGALIPGLPVNGTAHIKVWTEKWPTATLPDPVMQPGVSDPSMLIEDVVVNVKVPGNGMAPPLDLTLRTELTATAVIEITPPELGGTANPEGNRIQFRMKDFGIGTTTATYGPGSAVLTQAEREQLLNEVVLPMYKTKVGTVPLSSSIIDFQVPGTNRRAALKVLRKARVYDAIAVYVRFDISPAGDNIAPVVTVQDVGGAAPNAATREVLVGENEAIVHYTATDNFPDYLDYVQFETRLGLTGWTDRDYVRALKMTDLSEGVNWFYVRARDFANNLSADPTSAAGRNASVKITVDTLPPTTAFTAQPPQFTNQTSQTVVYAGLDSGSGVASYTVTLDGVVQGAATTATSKTVSGLAEGPHTIKVVAKDRVAHVDPVGAEAIFTVDLTAPKTALTGARTGYVKPSAARFAVLGADNFTAPAQIKFATMLTGPACATTAFSSFQALSTVDVTGCALLDGAYTLHVKSQDLAGNDEEMPAQRAFVVDGTPPRVQIIDKPDERSTAQTLEFTLLGTDNLTPPQGLTYTYRITGLSDDYSAPVSDPHVVVEGLPSGDYVFEVSAADFAANLSPVASFPFSLDNRAPTTSLTEAPPAWVTAESFTLAVSGLDDRTAPGALAYDVQLNGGNVRRYNAPLQLTAVEEGRHTAIVRAVDEFGNVDPIGISTQFTIDRTAPETEMVRAPQRVTTGNWRPAVTGNDNFTPQDELRYSYRLSRAGSEGEWSAPVPLNELQIGLRELGVVTMEIAAVDNAGLIDETPVKLTTDVKPVGGCACSSSETSPEDVASFLALAALVLFLRRRRR
ncbi:MAG: MYXO-CTERM sorting domain-containing protein [Deltaproteobacteria bacterium]|nr:MYXO-CTERM sorting domain-containing protein [Deltaproteobacteria bacterium]